MEQYICVACRKPCEKPIGYTVYFDTDTWRWMWDGNVLCSAECAKLFKEGT